MRATIKTGLILTSLLIAATACGSGSDPRNAIVGEWSGECATTKDQDGSKLGDNEKAKLRFTQDGKFSQSVSGPGEVSGSYTIAGQTLTLTADGDSTKTNYSIKDGVLTTTTQGNADGVPVTSICNLRQG